MKLIFVYIYIFRNDQLLVECHFINQTFYQMYLENNSYKNKV